MKKIGERVIGKGDWLILREDSYLNRNGEEVHWESVQHTGNSYVVVVVARLVPSGQFIFLRQYRQAIENTVIGFCAGAAPHGSDPAVEAMRELREETGYVGHVVGSSPQLKLNAGLIDDDLYILSAEVDESDPRNQHPRQELEPCEEIEVVLLKPEEIPAFLAKERAAGRTIGAGIWYMFGALSLFPGRA